MPYLGIGPSAHSFNGHSRQWNVRNNALYLKAVQQEAIPCETEQLTTADRLNEYIMTALRTIWGVDIEVVERRFGRDHRHAVDRALKQFVLSEDVVRSGTVFTLTSKGKLFADHIAAELFVEQED